MWRARVSRCLAFFLASLFSPDTGKYGDQIAFRDRYKHRGEDCFCVLIHADIASVYLRNCVRDGFASYIRNRNVDGIRNFSDLVGDVKRRSQSTTGTKMMHGSHIHQWDASGRAAANRCRGKGERKQVRKRSGPNPRFVRHTHLVGQRLTAVI